uniref:Uncharacterized protein n=1 Tax=Arundo donax TaxID=35708 RepID=A0A0A9BTT6_ARUDO
MCNPLSKQASSHSLYLFTTWKDLWSCGHQTVDAVLLVCKYLSSK